MARDGPRNWSERPFTRVRLNLKIASRDARQGPARAGHEARMNNTGVLGLIVLMSIYPCPLAAVTFGQAHLQVFLDVVAQLLCLRGLS